jgi:hypothetical protein
MSEKGTFDSTNQSKRLPPYVLSSRPPPPTSSTQTDRVNDPEEDSSSDDEDEFSFTDLQHVQFLEEKANEILLVLESNINVISEVRKHYQETIASEDWPEALTKSCVREFVRFDKSTSSVISDLQMQHSRTKMMLQLLTDRKSLVSRRFYRDESC